MFQSDNLSINSSWRYNNFFNPGIKETLDNVKKDDIGCSLSVYYYKETNTLRTIIEEKDISVNHNIREKSGLYESSFLLF